MNWKAGDEGERRCSQRWVGNGPGCVTINPVPVIRPQVSMFIGLLAERHFILFISPRMTTVDSSSPMERILERCCGTSRLLAAAGTLSASHHHPLQPQGEWLDSRCSMTVPMKPLILCSPQLIHSRLSNRLAAIRLAFSARISAHLASCRV